MEKVTITVDKFLVDAFKLAVENFKNQPDAHIHKLQYRLSSAAVMLSSAVLYEATQKEKAVNEK